MPPELEDDDDLGDFLDDDHQRIHEFASDFLDEDERESFIDSLMERRGYERVQSWAPPKQDPRSQRKPVLPAKQEGGQGGGRRGGKSPYFKR